MTIRVKRGYESGREHGTLPIHGITGEEPIRTLPNGRAYSQPISMPNPIQSKGSTNPPDGVKKIGLKSVNLISPTPPPISKIDNVHKSYSSYLSQMGDEDTDWLHYTEAVNSLLSTRYIASLQDIGASIVSNVTCSAINSSVSNGTITYNREVRVGATNWPVKTFKVANTVTTEQGTLTGPGRMNGLGGWSADGNMVAAILASYNHNFVVSLLAYFSRAALPLSKKVELPNLVLSETRAPPQFVPPLSMTYRVPPTPFMTNTIRASAPVDSSFYVVLWDSSMKEIGKSDVLSIPAGTSDVIVNSQLSPFENTGYFNIEPYDAPQGLVIESITTIPPTF